MPRPRWLRALLVVGLAAMILGVIDPLEGSVVIVVGAALVVVAANVARSRYAGFLTRSFALILVGVAAMVMLSWMGGVGGTTGRSYWWAALILSYPIGWVMAVIGAVRWLREFRRATA